MSRAPEALVPRPRETSRREAPIGRTAGAVVIDDEKVDWWTPFASLFAIAMYFGSQVTRTWRASRNLLIAQLVPIGLFAGLALGTGFGQDPIVILVLAAFLELVITGALVGSVLRLAYRSWRTSA
jgi:hypothetical protein